ncbi:PASTA domain-containing protein [Streptomyces adustus]
MSSIQLTFVHSLATLVDRPGSADRTATADSGFIWAIFWFAIAVSTVALGAKIAFVIFKRSDHGIVRSALAIILVTSLALLAAVVHFDDANAERQTLLLGAVATLASAVVAFYFSSRSAEAARKDLLSTMSGDSQVSVPDLVGMDVAAAKSKMSASNMSLTLPQEAPAEAVIVTQSPTPGEVVPPGRTVTVTTSTPQA